MNRLTNWLRRFRRSEDGSVTVEFVIIFPIFMILFINAFELGTVMLRQTMLDRGVDMAVRQVRLGALTPVTHDNLKDLICDRAAVLPDCANELKLEMVVIDPRNWTDMNERADCIDVEDRSQPPDAFEAGLANEMMILRACHLFEPYFTDYSIGSLLGDVIPKESGTMYGLVSTSSYVVEPN